MANTASSPSWTELENNSDCSLDRSRAPSRVKAVRSLMALCVISAHVRDGKKGRRRAMFTSVRRLNTRPLTYCLMLRCRLLFKK